MKLRRLHIILFLATASACLWSCDGSLDLVGMFWTRSDTPDERFEQSRSLDVDPTNTRIQYAPSRDYRVYLLSDIHVDQTTLNLDKFVHTYVADRTAADFCLFMGDYVNRSGVFPLVSQHLQPVADAGRKIFGTPGNHDIYYGEWKEYAALFGASSYVFTVMLPEGGSDLYICLDSASGSLGRKQMEWLRSSLEAYAGFPFRHRIVFTHTNFFKEDGYQGHSGNFNVEETLDLCGLFHRYGVGLVLTGHRHYRNETFFEGVRYVTLDASSDSQTNPHYAVLSLSDGSAEINFVPLDSTVK